MISGFLSVVEDAEPRYWARPSDKAFAFARQRIQATMYLHCTEIGHILGKFQDRTRLTRELWA